MMQKEEYVNVIEVYGDRCTNVFTTFGILVKGAKYKNVRPILQYNKTNKKYLVYNLLMLMFMLYVCTIYLFPTYSHISTHIPSTYIYIHISYE